MDLGWLGVAMAVAGGIAVLAIAGTVLYWAVMPY